MADNRFIGGNQLGLLDNTYGAPSSVFHVSTVASTTAYNAVLNLTRPVKVVRVWGFMTGAGGAGDTVVVKNGSTAITETIDLSALADKEVFQATSLDDAQWLVSKDGSITVTSASDALTELFIEVINA